MTIAQLEKAFQEYKAATDKRIATLEKKLKEVETSQICQQFGLS